MLDSLKQSLFPKVSAISGLPIERLEELFEVPKQLSHGHLALPVFEVAKTQKTSPQDLAKKISNDLSEVFPEMLASVLPLGGFVNFTFRDDFLQQQLWAVIQKEKNKYGHKSTSSGKTVIVEYSSPNVAKPMSIGHLRATVIGQAIRNLADTQGHKVIGINHLGDWGVQFGKLAWAYDNWITEEVFDRAPFENLFSLYVRFHEEAEKDQSLDEKGIEYFRRLEKKDPHVWKIWEKFREISIKEYQKIYDLLGVRFDLVQGEAFYNDLLAGAVERVEKAGILSDSEGAKVVFWDEKNPPCILVKSDGSSIYATRDLASAFWRHEVLKADQFLYVVGSEQTLHFQQVFGVLKKMGCEWANNCHHVAFGLYRFKDMGKMSTRKGNVIFMKDVLDKAISMAREIIKEKNPELPNADQVAEQVGIGAVIFNDLMNDRVKNVDFDWEKILDFEGDTGPYVQYTRARCASVLRKSKEVPDLSQGPALSSDEERLLLKNLMVYPLFLRKGYQGFKPNVIAQYLLEICRNFNHFYHVHRVLDEDIKIQRARLGLVKMTSQVLVSGLEILGISSPDAM